MVEVGMASLGYAIHWFQIVLGGPSNNSRLRRPTGVYDSEFGHKLSTIARAKVIIGAMTTFA